MDTPTDVIGRASSVLRAIAASAPGGVSTSQLARATSLPRATVHRLLTALMGEGLTDRENRSGQWFLGPELYLFGVAAAQRYDVTEVAQPFVRALAVSTGESAFFSARRGDESICLLREDGSFPLRSHVLHEGIRFPLGVASAGLVMLAFLPDREINAYLAGADLVERFGTDHSAASIQARISKTRSDGYATNPGLIVEGSWGLATAVFDLAGRPQWALTLTGVEQRFGPGRRPELGTLLLDAAHRLTGSLATRGRQS